MGIIVDERLPGGHAFGAVVRGVDAEALSDAAVRARLAELWRDKSVLVFRDIPDAGAHRALASIFGVQGEHPMQRKPGATTPPRPVDIRFDDKAGGDLYEVDGVLVGGYQPWHIDWIYLDEIARGGVMRAVTLPGIGGATGFIDRCDAYDALPPALAARIALLSVLYRYDPDATHVKFGKTADRCIRISAPLATGSAHERVARRSIHPLVFEHPVTGRKALQLSQWFADAVEGLDIAESDALLAELTEHMIRPEAAYHHAWQPGDVVLWDNWRVLHCATGVPVGEIRHMTRIDLVDAYRGGRYEQAAA